MFRRFQTVRNRAKQGGAAFCGTLIARTSEGADTPDQEVTLSLSTITIIIAHTRPEIRVCLASLARQTLPSERFDVVAVGNSPEDVNPNEFPFALRYIECADRNPSARRNIGISHARGDILAFLDDDAEATDDWLERALGVFQSDPSIGVVGGPKLLPRGAPLSHRLTYKIAHAGFFGNGHENLHRDANELRVVLGYITCCNLFVFPARIKESDPFEIHIGYGGEDTAFLYQISRRNHCKIQYSVSVVVYHSPGGFGLRFLAKRFGFRFNNGMMLWACPRLYLMNRKFATGLVVAALLLILFAFKPLAVFPVGALHQAISFAYAVRYRREDWRLCVLFPPALLTQHMVYTAGLLAGILSVADPRLRKRIRNIRERLR